MKPTNEKFRNQLDQMYNKLENTYPDVYEQIGNGDDHVTGILEEDIIADSLSENHPAEDLLRKIAWFREKHWEEIYG